MLEPRLLSAPWAFSQAVLNRVLTFYRLTVAKALTVTPTLTSSRQVPPWVAFVAESVAVSYNHSLAGVQIILAHASASIRFVISKLPASLLTPVMTPLHSLWTRLQPVNSKPKPIGLILLPTRQQSTPVLFPAPPPPTCPRAFEAVEWVVLNPPQCFNQTPLARSDSQQTPPPLAFPWFSVWHRVAILIRMKWISELCRRLSARIAMIGPPYPTDLSLFLDGLHLLFQMGSRSFRAAALCLPRPTMLLQLLRQLLQSLRLLFHLLF